VPSTESVTILFTDLVGSTALASQLSLEAANDVRRVHFSVLRQAIAATGGKEVKNLGDGLMVAFSSTSSALACAVAMQQGIERSNRRTGQGLGLRAALSCGEATWEADDYFGDPVVEAARLCAQAQGAQILVSDIVRAMAGRRSPHSFRSLGTLTLKGLPEPVGTFEVGWEPVDEQEIAPHGVPLPSRLATRPATGVIGRSEQATLLADALKRVAAGDGREVVLVSGEPGMGKTTLAAQLARAAFEAGACVLLGRCDEEVGAPYAPFLEALHQFVSHAPEEVLWEHVRSYGGELVKMIPALRDRLGRLPSTQSTDPDTERYLLYGAVVGLLAQASSWHPVVLILDDLQWADKPSLQLVRQVVASEKPTRLLIVGTYRDSELSGSHPLTENLVALRREPNVSRVELKGLDDSEVLAFVEAAAGYDLDDEGVGLAHAVYRETDGNPFFVGEVLRHLVESGSINQDATGRWTSTGSIEDLVLPESVVQVIGSRVGRLGDGARQALSLASVIGREFDLGLLSGATDRSEDDLIDILDRAATNDLVREVTDVPGRFSFSHALIQHTLFQDMGATRRVRAHRRVAEALEAICGDDPGERVGELAYHWASATQPVDALKAVSYSRQAAEAALASLAPDEAVRYFTQALHYLGQQAPDDVLRMDLLIGLGNAQRQSGNPDFRATFLEAASKARELGDSERLVAAALGNNRGLVSAVGAMDAERVAVLEAALDAAPQGDSVERALLLATLSAELTYGSPLEQRRPLADEARSMARRMGDAATLIQVMTLVTHPLNVPWLHAERLWDSTEALSAAQGLGDPVLLFISTGFRHMNAVQAGDFTLADGCMDTMRELSQRLGQPPLRFATALTEASKALVVGDPDRAEHFANLALQIGTDSGQPDAFALYGTQVMIVRHQQGRLSELVSLIDQIATENSGVPAFTAALAAALLEAGDSDRALQILQASAQNEFASTPKDAQWLHTLVCYAEVAIELGVVSAAEHLRALLAPFHQQIPYNTVVSLEPISFFLGGLASVLGRPDEASEYFAEAMEVSTRGGMKFAGARTQLAWGRMLSVRENEADRRESYEFVRQAHATAAALGYVLVERRAAEQLSGMTPPDVTSR
jgi:class 3 adenylate cyclase